MRDHRPQVATAPPPERSDGRRLYVVGGRQREPRSLLDQRAGWYGYSSGCIAEVTAAGVDTVLTYVSKPGTCAPEDPVLFKSATLQGDRLWCCTQTEVVVFEVPTWREVLHVSLPRFNDVHHVVPRPSGTFLVANSGMETVVELTPDGEVVEEWNVLGEDTWATHDPAIDYRHGVDLKPHRAHPNHVFLLGDEPWATRFEQRDAISLVDPRRRIDVGGERIHDGVPHDGRIWFTAVDGVLVAVDEATLEVVERVELTDGRGERAGLGWCRGLLFEAADGDVPASCWVGFTRIRPTRFRQTVSWVRTRGAPDTATRVVRYRTSDWACVDEVDVEPAGLNAVFSVVRA